VLVTARDIAVMAATLANRGVNPVTGEQVLTPYAISRTLSVMTSSGMYDYAGEWIYRIGIPAKSGVGGGILAALPARLGLGSYSPKLDKHGNSVRGIKVCEALSSHYDLHMLNRSDDARNAVIADYDIGKSPSRRVRRPQEREILAAHEQEVRIIELVGTLSLSAVDYVSRRLAGRPRPQFVIFDLHRVTSTTRAGARLVAEAFEELAALNVTVVLSGVSRASKEWNTLREWTAELKNVRDFYLLDTAIEWAEDQIVYRHGGSIDFHETTELVEQPLLEGLSAEEVTELSAICSIRTYQSGAKILTTGDPASSLFFLRSGAVHVTLPDGVRLATLTAGMACGEMALLEQTRSADVFADMAATAFEIPLKDFERFREQHPRASERIMRNLAQLLADRLIVANTKVDILTST
jgi:glutaminase